MERVNKRLKNLYSALMRLEESLLTLHNPDAAPFREQIRDSVIQRLEFTADLFWKCLKDYLEENHSMIVASPKTVFRESVNQKMMTLQEGKVFEQMIDDRNDTSHKYDASMTEEIVKRAPIFLEAMNKTIAFSFEK